MPGQPQLRATRGKAVDPQPASRGMLSSATTWILACVGMAAATIFPFLVVVDRSNIWTVLLGWPLGYLLARVVAKRRGLSDYARRRVLNWGVLAIFIVMFVDARRESVG